MKSRAVRDFGAMGRPIGSATLGGPSCFGGDSLSAASPAAPGASARRQPARYAPWRRPNARARPAIAQLLPALRSPFERSRSLLVCPQIISLERRALLLLRRVMVILIVPLGVLDMLGLASC